MNIEIANRLVQLRKEKNLSQEALANELGISRQAVSKWERAEASPDTDNLISLAKLYGVSLDELLKTDQFQFESSKTSDEKTDSYSFKKEEKKEKDEYVHISLAKGIHVKEKNGDEVHVGWKGIHVSEGGSKNDVDWDESGVFVNGKEYDCKDWASYHNEYRYDFPIGVIVTVIYLFIGFAYGTWHPSWLIFGIIPLFHSMISAYRHRDLLRFSYPILVFMIIGYYGFVVGEWYPSWLLVLSIPIFYSLFGYIKYARKK